MRTSAQETDCEARLGEEAKNPSAPSPRADVHPGFKVLAILAGIALLVTGAIFMADPNTGTVSNLFHRHRPSLHSLSTPSGDGYHMVTQLSLYMSKLKVLHLAEGVMSLEEALQQLHRWPGVLVLAVAGPGKPCRRTDSQPFLSTDDYTAAVLPVQALNAAAGMAEEALGRRLFPLALTAVDFWGLDRAAGGAVLPYAVFEVSTGRILLDASLVSGPWSAPGAWQLMDSLASGFFSHAAPLLPKVRTLASRATNDSSPIIFLLTILGPAAAAAVAGAFAISTAPPLWFCVVCPTLLGLIAPLAINFGLGQAAGEVCKALTLGDDECFDVFLGALGLGFVLSLASAVPIFFVCRLKECARGNGTLLALGGEAWRGMRLGA